MTESNRDDFNIKTKNALALRANHRCSFRGCGHPTSGPSDESTSATVNIGVAAHIHAAAPGGPRYLASMTSDKRSGIENGIWLCATHSALVDRDCVTYTAEILRGMKNEHENRVSTEIAGSVRHSRLAIDLVALGPSLIFTGELTAVSGTLWKIRIDHFIIGDVSDLIAISEGFDRFDPYDRYVLVDTLGDGRQLATSPSWEKVDAKYVVSCHVREAFPRTNAHALKADIAFGDDISLTKNGSITMVSGLNALPQKIRTCLSMGRGESPFHRNFGSKIREYFGLFNGSPWLSRLIKLEVIRLACIPYHQQVYGEYTPFMSVSRVNSVDLRPEASGRKGWRTFHFQLEVEGVGKWDRDIPVFVGKEQSD